MSSLTNRHAAADNLTQLIETAFMLRRRIVVCMMTILAVSLAIALAVKPVYVATSQLAVLPSDEYTFRATAGSHSLANEALSRHAMMGSEVAILKSASLAHSVIAAVGLKPLYPALARKPGLLARLFASVHDLILPPPKTRGKADPIESAVPLFESHLTAIAGTDDDVITVSFGNPDAAVAERALATLETQYLERRRAIFTDEQSSAVAAQLATQRIALDRAEARLSAFEAAHSVTQFQTREAILLNQQGRMEQDAMTASSAIAQTTASLASLRHASAGTPHTIPLEQSTDIDQRTAALRTSLDQLRTRLATTLSTYRAGSPQAADLRRQIATESALLARAQANGAPSSLQNGQNPVFAQIALETMQDTTALAAARTRAIADHAALHHIATQLTALDTLKSRLQSLQRQQQIAAANDAAAARTLGQRQMVEQVDAEKRANVRILSAPVQPLYPYPLRKLIMVAGALLALIGAVTVTLLGNLLRQGALLARILETDTGIPLLATIPELQPEQVRMLRIQ